MSFFPQVDAKAPPLTARTALALAPAPAAWKQAHRWGLGVSGNAVLWHGRAPLFSGTALERPFSFRSLLSHRPSFTCCVNHRACGPSAAMRPLRLWACASGAAEKRVFAQNGASEVVFGKASKRKCAPCLFLAHSATRQIPAVKIFWCKASSAARVAGVGIHRAQCLEGHPGFLTIMLLYTWHGPVSQRA